MTGPAVEIVEVSPRDGLQDEPGTVPTAAKVELVELALAAGVRRVEAVSFVRPDRVPAMADAEAVLAGVTRPSGSRLAGLVLNRRGLERALAAGVDDVQVVVVVTETFSRRNQGTGVAEALAMWEAVAAEAHRGGVGASVTLAAAFGCPYEGTVAPSLVRELARRAAEAGPFEIALADTIGCAVPPEVDALVRGVAADTGLPVRLHLHNSRNTGYANAVAGVAAGASALDASLGGIGGCPFAPGATGNIATEDLVHLLDRMGVRTGVDLDPLLDASTWLAATLGHPLPGQVVRAGAFPRTRSAAP
jgi:hydroxymethylglutaryl-CoA lyase